MSRLIRLPLLLFAALWLASAAPAAAGDMPGSGLQKEDGVCKAHRGFDCRFPDLSETCLPCGVMKRLVEVTEMLGERVFNSVRASMQALIGMILGLAILFQAGKLLFPFGPIDKGRDILNSVVTRTGLTMMVALALGSFNNYWNYIHQPVLLGALNLTSAIMKEVETGAAQQEVINAVSLSARPPGWMYPNNTLLRTKETCPADAVTTIAGGVDCVTRRMQKAIGDGMGAGLDVMLKGIPNVGLWNAMAIFTMIATGTVLMVIYGIAFLNFPLKIADVVIRWTLFSVLSPLVLAALIYPATRSFCIVSLRGLFQACMEMVMIGVIIALTGFAILALGDWKEGLVGSEGPAKVLLMNNVVFWQLVMVGIVMNMMISKAKTFASALTVAAFDTNVAGEAMDKLTNLGAEMNKKGGDALKSTLASRGMIKP